MILTKETIPTDWQLRAVLGRDCRCAEPERFAFYAVGEKVAVVSYHPMNGWNYLWTKIDSKDWMRDYYAELMAGEPFRNVESKSYGRLDVREGRRPKAYRLEA